METIVIIVVLSALLWVLMPRNRRETYRSETGHNARLAVIVMHIDGDKVSRRLSQWVK